MNQLSFGNVCLIAMSILAAFVLSVLPLPEWLQVIWPQWLVLVVIYWITALPHRFSLGITWCLGLLLDVLYGSILGEHAFALVVVAYFADRMHRQLKLYPLFQQALCILVLVGIYEMMLIWIQGILGLVTLKHVMNAGVSILISMLLWPWVYTLLRSMKLRYKID